VRISSIGPYASLLDRLARTDTQIQNAAARLATGKRILQASDDPAGSVLSATLRAKIQSLSQVMENLSVGQSRTAVADTALAKISDYLIQIREAVVGALNTSSSDTLDSYQDTVDEAVSAINRLARTTSFGSEKLLNGSVSIQTASTVGTALQEVRIFRAAFYGASALTVSLRITGAASRAALFTGSSFQSAAAGTVVRITGPEGTEEITLGSSFTTTAFESAVNAVTDDTGVFASGGALFSVDYGSDQSISLSVVSGSVKFGSQTLTSSSSSVQDSGADITGYIQGQPFSGQGLRASFSANGLAGEIRFREGTTPGTTAFKIRPTGLSFTASLDGSREIVGFPPVDAPYLGQPTQEIPTNGGSTKTIFGWLNTIVSGGDNDLSTDPENALRIVDAASDWISRIRGWLGSYQSFMLEGQLSAAQSIWAELSEAHSRIADVDYAQEVAHWTRLQVLQEAGTAALSRMNLSRERTFQLILGGFLPQGH